MKNLFLFLSFLFLSFDAFSQKNIDLGIEMISPAANGVYNNLSNGDTFHHVVVVTNYGPDTVKAGQDSMYVTIDLNLPIQSGGWYMSYLLGDSTLIPGQSDTFRFEFVEGQNLAGSTIHYPINDTVLATAVVFGKQNYDIPFSDFGYSGNGTFLDVDPLNYPGNNRVINTNIIFKTPTPESIDVTVNNNFPPAITTYNGTLQINSNILPAGANQNVTWSIQPVGIATLNSSASSTIIAPSNNGVVWVKAVSVQNPLLADSIMVTISGQKPDSLVVRTQGGVPAVIDSISHTLQLQAQVYPTGLPQDVVWEIIPVDGAANVSITGLVTATAFGKVWAKAQSIALVNYSDSILINITNNPLSIKETNITSIVDIYPNPVKDELTIVLDNKHTDLVVSISNIEGKVLKKHNLENSSGTLKLSMKDLQSGIYFLQFNGRGVNFTRKIIKQ